MAAKGDRTRAHILKVLRDVLRDTGYEGTSIAEITRRAEITRPAFYFHFESLGQAIASLMEDFLERSFAVESGWFDHSGNDQPANLRYGVDHTVRLWRKDPVVMDAMARAAASDPAAHRTWRRWIELFSARTRPTVRTDAVALTPAECDRVADILVAGTFDAMQRDVRHIVDGGRPDPHLADTIAEVWIRTIYR